MEWIWMGTISSVEEPVFASVWKADTMTAGNRIANREVIAKREVRAEVWKNGQIWNMKQGQDARVYERIKTVIGEDRV